MKLAVNPTSGQSLVEVVTAVAIVSIILVGMVSAITFGISSTQFSLNKTRATKLAQEGVEWLRDQRDELGWSAFYNKATDGSETYCLNDLSSWPSPGSCTSTMVNEIFTREAVLDGNSTLSPNDRDRVEVTMTVSWPQSERTEGVTINTYLTKWQ